ncbi:MAG: hypothetical protein ACREAU_00540 [Nitrosopumilaceae archaeon]
MNTNGAQAPFVCKEQQYIIMKVYLVGGAVRDELLNRNREWM